ncbi:hypothetical protein CTAM01_01242 [Colletotrichum tamarilloi]|uniref:Uncharacterized protein n=1 Tax=Colletotrichum tamarilloi TaxID=1209934 RepID=A0ABQ9RQL4_9PEZI|nr:uncharacterized protein CTAM01_01242 [Colletotrichum tamarilloi]KAK1510669.1 hypothetical protein CTAM01_01242 [Colletotrichum tamarilloi]
MAAIPTYNNCGNQPCRKRTPLPSSPSPPKCAMHNRPDPISRPKYSNTMRRPAEDRKAKGNTRQASGHRRAVATFAARQQTHMDVKLEKVWLNTGCQRPSFATQCLAPFFSMSREKKPPRPSQRDGGRMDWKNRSIVAEYIDTSTFCEETGVLLSLCCWFPHHHHHHENHQHHDHQGRADSFLCLLLTIFASTYNG